MKLRLACLFLPLLTSTAFAQGAGIDVTVGGHDNGVIRAKHTFCAADPNDMNKDGGNISPEISWTPGPKGTRSYAIIMHDPDVPANFEDANRRGRTLPINMPRREFAHWVLVDIPGDVTSLPEGADSDKLDKRGKRPGKTKNGVRGLNDYGKFMSGAFGGYDGPCPPWNDERWHHYNFDVYALDTKYLDLNGDFGAKAALKAMRPHILAQGRAVLKYTRNPALMGGEPPAQKEEGNNADAVPVQDE